MSSVDFAQFCHFCEFSWSASQWHDRLSVQFGKFPLWLNSINWWINVMIIRFFLCCIWKNKSAFQFTVIYLLLDWIGLIQGAKLLVANSNLVICIHHVYYLCGLALIGQLITTYFSFTHSYADMRGTLLHIFSLYTVMFCFVLNVYDI